MGWKKMELSYALLLFVSKKYKSSHVLHEVFLKPQYKCAEVSQFSISTPYFSVALSFLRIPQTQDQQIAKHSVD